MNYGFIEPVLKQEDWVLSGNLDKIILQEDGQWGNFLPEVEYQKKYGIETSACATFTSLNCLEILFNRVYNLQANFSERYTSILGSTTPLGASPQDVAESMRKNGVIAQKYLPFDESIETFDDFHSPTPMAEKYLEIGAEWLEYNSIFHDWVVIPSDKDKPKQLMEALKTSPLLVSVKAWSSDGEYYVKTKGDRDNHATTLYGYVEGKYWKVFDSYDNVHKKLAWDYDFGWAKRFVLAKKVAENEQQALVERLVDMWITFWRTLRSMLGF